MESAQYGDRVFINCPFDGAYLPLFHATIFAVIGCGFVTRCAQEADDSSDVRIDKIFRIIKASKYGIHDISRTEPDSINHLPRFNMPLELGIFLAAKRLGSGIQKSKVCLILDSEKYRYQKFISDIAGQDIRSHENDPGEIISHIRNWLVTASGRKTIPGGREITRWYQLFRLHLPGMCRNLKMDEDELTYNDYSEMVIEWFSKLAQTNAPPA